MQAAERVERNVVLCGYYATGYKDGQSVPATHLWREDVKKSVRGKTERKFSGLTVSLVNGWGKNYFHWVLECLTMLLCIDPWKIDHILLPTWYHPFALESLEDLKLADRVIKWDGRNTEVDLISFGPQRVDGESWRPGIDRLRAVFAEPPKGSRKVFVDRVKVKYRKAINAGDWIACHPDYERLDPGGTVRDQARYFSHVKTIVGPHGAGLTNMVWARDAEVVEFFGSYHNDCFEKLAKTLGHEYTAVQGVPVGEDMMLPCP